MTLLEAVQLQMEYAAASEAGSADGPTKGWGLTSLQLEQLQQLRNGIGQLIDTQSSGPSTGPPASMQKEALVVLSKGESTLGATPKGPPEKSQSEGFNGRVKPLSTSEQEPLVPEQPSLDVRRSPRECSTVLQRNENAAGSDPVPSNRSFGSLNPTDSSAVSPRLRLRSTLSHPRMALAQPPAKQPIRKPRIGVRKPLKKLPPLAKVPTGSSLLLTPRVHGVLIDRNRRMNAGKRVIRDPGETSEEDEDTPPPRVPKAQRTSVVMMHRYSMEAAAAIARQARASSPKRRRSESLALPIWQSERRRGFAAALAEGEPSPEDLAAIDALQALLCGEF